MRWITWLRAVPFLSARAALADVTRKLRENEQELRRLRERLAAQKARLAEEKQRRRRLEKRLARRKSPQPAPQRPLTPHRQVFQAVSANRYRFANVVSYPKSGRTWFSTLYFHYARCLFGASTVKQQSLHMPDRNLEFQQLLADKAKGGCFPVCVFTHLGFSSRKPFEDRPEPWPDKATAVLKRPTVLIVRDPRDVVVSHYHHLRAMGGVLDPEPSLSDFVRGDWGIERVVRFMNLWAAALASRHPNLLLCTYESLKTDTAGAFANALAFLGAEINPEALGHAVEESSFDKLKERERSNRTFQGASLEPDAFRFRRGGVGGYARELSAFDAAYLDQIVADELDPVFSSYHRQSIQA